MPETLKKMRLDKFLTQAAELTRSEAKQKIKKGSVTVNGEVVKKAEMKVSSEDAICLDGEVVTYEKYRYIMLHKPAGVVSATEDAQCQMESSFTPAYNSAYVEGINNLYEFDCGQLSGWMYNVNGWFPNYGCSKYTVQDGDVINWVYTCNLGKDVGDNSMY